jgi:hypothetical protein
LITGKDRVGYATDLDNVSVASGDMIRFEVSANGDSTYGTTSWTPSIAYTASAAGSSILSLSKDREDTKKPGNPMPHAGR